VSLQTSNFKEFIDEKEPGLFLQCINTYSK
jgi:hypothetical protein